MRLIIVLFLCLSAIFSASSNACAEPATQSGISFSVPFNCDQEGDEGLSLADSFKPDLKVVLLSEGSSCALKTGRSFTYSHPARDFSATHLLDHKKCSTGGDEDIFGKFLIAAVGADPSTVAVAPRDDEFIIPKHLELKARLLAKSPTSDPSKPEPRSGVHKAIANSSPRVIPVKGATLLIFQCVYRPSGEDELYDGPPVVVMNNDVFRLSGACLGTPLFFLVKEKLYLTYSATVFCCGCGDTNFLVYDLSGKAPEEVYWNSNFSN